MTAAAGPATSADAAADRTPVRRLGSGGRIRRLVATGAVGGLLLLGTWRGSDDHFPLGPFLMFAGRNPPTLDVPSTFLQAVTSTGQVLRVDGAASGLRRAELEGQLASLTRNPAQLRDVAAAHQRRDPQAPAYVEVRIVQRRFHLRDREYRGFTDVLLAAWRSP